MNWIQLQQARGIAATLALVAALGGCTAGAVSGGGGLAPGLTARMDAPGAVLNRAEALSILNAYRSSRGTPPLAPDTSLDTVAQSLATQYAASGATPSTPQGNTGMRLSAGYVNFAETFSGWRNSPADAAVIAAAGARRAGLGVAFNAASTYGTYWVLLLDD